MITHRLWICALLLVVLLVVPVSAVTTIINASYNYNPFDTTDAVFPTIRNETGDSSNSVTSTLMGGQTIATATSGVIDYHIRSFVTWDTSSLPDSAIIDWVLVNVTTIATPRLTLISTNASIIDTTPANPLSGAVTDYSQTTFTRMAPDLLRTSIAAVNNTNSFTLNSDGKSKINKTGTTSYMFDHSGSVDNINLSTSWSSGAISDFRYCSIAYAGGAFTPQLIIGYHLPASFSTYNMTTFNGTKILPNNDDNLPPAGTIISDNLTPGQYGSLSFIIKPNATISGINITNSVLTDITNSSNIIGATSINSRTVKVWYQSADGDVQYTTPGFFLEPELLLKNDSIVSCNYTNQNCSVWIKNNTFEGSFPIDNTTINQFPADAKIYNNASVSGDIQHLTLAENENRQIMITPYIPIGQPSGNYTGTITISAPSTIDQSTTNSSITINIRVLPFTLQNSTIDYSIYYMSILGYGGSTPDGRLTDNSTTGLQRRNNATYQAELLNLYNHGIRYPNMFDFWSNQSTDLSMYRSFGHSLYFRNVTGFPTDKIFLGEHVFPNSKLTIGEQAELVTNIGEARAQLSGYGITIGYGTEYDEPSIANMLAENLSYGTIRSNGAGTYSSTTVSSDLYHTIGNNVDVAIIPDTYNSTALSEWKSLTPPRKVYTYSNPQLGIEDPEIYRQNYGFALWRSGYDGAMGFAYQQNYGNSHWNDYDDSVYNKYRDEVMAYPITGGVIDTIQWEGYREGVDDSRYADELVRIEGNRTHALAIINAGIAAGVDMSVIRGNLIDAILYYGGAVHPTASFTKSRPVVLIPQSIYINDTSSNTPTMWNLSWGDGGWSNTTVAGEQNASHTYTLIGTYTINLTVSNAAGSSTATDSIPVYNNTTANFIGTPIAGTKTIRFNDTSDGYITNWSWQYNNQAAPGWTEFSTIQNPNYTFTNGVYDINLTVSGAGSSDYELKVGYIIIGGTSTAVGDNSTTTYPTQCSATPLTTGLMLMALALFIGGPITMVLTVFTNITSNYEPGKFNFIILGFIMFIVGAAMFIITYMVLGPMALIGGC